MNVLAHKKSRLLPLAWLLVILLAVSACGGGAESDAAADTPAIGKAELIKQGDAICAQTDKIQRSQLAAYAKQHPNAGKSESAYIQMLEIAALPPIAAELERLKALGAPKGEEAQVAAIFDGYAHDLTQAEAKLTTILTPTGGPFAGTEKLAARYGFKACAEPL